MNEASGSFGIGRSDGDLVAPVDLLLARRFHRDSGVAMLGHPVAAAALAVLTWGHVPAWQVATGVAGVLVATLLRSILHRRAARHTNDAAALCRGTRASTAAVAGAWGLTALLLLPQVATGIEARILLILAGLTAAGVATHAADAKGFKLFTALTLGPAVAGVVLNGYDATTGVDVVVIAAYWATMLVLQRRSHDQLTEQLATRARLQVSTHHATREKEFLDAVLASTPVGLALLDPQGRLGRMNDLFRELLSVPDAEAASQAGSAHGDEVDSPERAGVQLASFKGRDPLWDALIGAVRTLSRHPDQGMAEREVIVSRAGSRAWLNVSAAPGRDEATGWTVLQVEDVSSLRRAEEASRAAEAEYSELVETANDLIWRVDKHGRWTFLNRAAQTIYGVPPHALLGRSAMDHAPGEYRNADYEALASILDGGEIIDYETRHERADGSARWLSFSGRPVRDDEGRIVGAQGVARDVTAQVQGRRALERLAERNSLVRSLINASEDLIFYKDQDGLYQGCNAAFADFVGLSEHEVVGYTDEELYDPEEAALYRATDREVLRSGEPWVGESWEEGGPGGERRLLETVKTPFVDADGTVLGILGIGRDVTARKQAEERMRHAAAEARRATQMKSAFLANMSHEIRTPMNGVLGMAELLQGTELDTEQRQYVDIVRSSAQNLLGILNDILDFSKIEAGHLELETIPFDLTAEMADALRVLSVNASAKGDELLLDADPDLPTWVVGDPGRMRQVVTNLLGNAIKFTEGGEVELALELLRSPGRAGDPHTVRVAVRDTGIGIPEAKLPLIFEEFSQADSSVTRRFGGTGLGLTISRRLVELMGGEIGVESTLGEGSTFWFTVPLLATEAPASAPARPPVDALSLSGVRVLVVDDNETNRSILSRILGEAGAMVDEAHDGATALRRLRELGGHGRLPHLILMDVQMPEMDGLEVVRRIREDEGDDAMARIPVVVLTSANRTEDVSRARTLGVESYHLKPLPRRELLQVAAAHLEEVSTPAECGAATGDSPGGDTDRGRMAGVSPTADTMTAVPSIGGADPAGPHPDEPPEGPRIVLAEDNPVNRMVAETMLRKEGYRVTSAVTGTEAVTAVRTGGVCAVLMDVQMPEMDGIEATRAIRDLPPPLGGVPIVALTAHALEEERQRCLTAGMDDFLSKPFHSDDLMAVLKRWVDGERSRRAAATPPRASADPTGAASGSPGGIEQSDRPAPADGPTPAPEPAPAGDIAPAPTEENTPTDHAPPPVDIESFRAMLEEAGIGQVVEPTLEVFARDLPERVAAVETALAAGEAEGLADAAHALKSSAANVRARRLAELLGRLEDDARNRELAELEVVGAEVIAEAGRVRSYLEAR